MTDGKWQRGCGVGQKLCEGQVVGAQAVGEQGVKLQRGQAQGMQVVQVGQVAGGPSDEGQQVGVRCSTEKALWLSSSAW